MTEEPMRTDLHAEAFFAADHAVVENGKMYVNGGYWTRLNHSSFPSVQNFALGIVFHIPWHAHNQLHKFAIWFEDADGNQTQARMEGQFQAGLAADSRAGDYSLVPVALTVNGFVLQKPGDYAAVLEMDGTEVARWRFRAVQVIGVPMVQRRGQGEPPVIDGPSAGN
jgi:hypothetical protein